MVSHVTYSGGAGNSRVMQAAIGQLQKTGSRVTTGRLQILACSERPVRLNPVVEILKMFRT